MGNVFDMEYAQLGNLLNNEVYGTLVERTTLANGKSIRIGNRKFPLEKVLAAMSDSHMPLSAYTVLLHRFKSQHTDPDIIAVAQRELAEVIIANGNAHGTLDGKGTGMAQHDGAVKTELKMNKRQRALYAVLCINESDANEVELGRRIITAHAHHNWPRLRELLLEYLNLEDVKQIAKQVADMAETRRAADVSDLIMFCNALGKAAKKVWEAAEGLKSLPEWKALEAEYGPRLAEAPANFRAMMPLAHEITRRISHLRIEARNDHVHYVIARGLMLPRQATLRPEEIREAASRIREGRLLAQRAGHMR
jgi:hypothetical protein